MALLSTGFRGNTDQVLSEGQRSTTRLLDGWLHRIMEGGFDNSVVAMLDALDLMTLQWLGERMLLSKTEIIRSKYEGGAEAWCLQLPLK